MSEITKKILESGLVDEHTAKLFAKWGAIEPSQAEAAPEKAQLETREQLLSFVHDLEKLLGQEVGVFRQTRLDWLAETLLVRPSWGAPVAAALDEAGRLLCGPSFSGRAGDEVIIESAGRLSKATVADVEALYKGDQVSGYLVTLGREES